MALTYEEALSKIGTEGYTGVEGLRRLVNETSVVPANATPNGTLILYTNDVGDQRAWRVAEQVSAIGVRVI